MSLLQQLDAVASEDRTRFVEAYLEILARADHPQDGDAAYLMELAGRIGRNRSEIARDLDRVRARQTAEALVARRDEYDRARAAAESAFIAAVAAADGLYAQLCAARDAADAARGELEGANRQRGACHEAEADLAGAIADYFNALRRGVAVADVRESRRGAKRAEFESQQAAERERLHAADNAAIRAGSASSEQPGAQVVS